MALAAAGTDVPRSVNGSGLSRVQLAAIIDRLLGAETVEARLKISGLDAARADIIVAGALILEGVMDALHVESLRFSDYALREGVLYDLWTLNDQVSEINEEGVSVRR